MFKLGLNIWNGIKVLVIDHTLETNAHIRHSFMLAAVNAPAAAVRMERQSYPMLQELLRDAQSDHFKSLLDIIPWDEQYIGLSYAVLKGMSDEHITALLHHEKAHIDNGDLLVAEGGIVEVEEFELRADQAGVAAVGKDVYRAALLSVIDRMADATSKELDVSYSEVFSSLINYPVMKERIVALS